MSGLRPPQSKSRSPCIASGWAQRWFASRSTCRRRGCASASSTRPIQQIELIEPLGADLPILKYLERNPEGGQHHLCFEVPDIDAARSFYDGKGVRILGPTRIGAHGTPIFFLHPKDMGGVLTEIMESPKQAH